MNREVREESCGLSSCWEVRIRPSAIHAPMHCNNLPFTCLLEALQDAGLAAAALGGGLLQEGIPRQGPGVALHASQRRLRMQRCGRREEGWIRRAVTLAQVGQTSW